VPSHRLEDRIRELCAQAIASDDVKFPVVLAERRSAIHEHVERIRVLAIQQLDGEMPREDQSLRMKA
jgi:hypothetical protein